MCLAFFAPPQHRIYNNSNTYYVLSFLVSNSLVLIIVRRKYKIFCDLVNIGQTAWKRLDVWVFLKLFIVFCLRQRFLFETMCSLGWPGTPYVDQTGLELKAKATMPLKAK